MSTQRPLQYLFASIPKPRPRLPRPHRLSPHRSAANTRCLHSSRCLLSSEKSQSYPKAPQGAHDRSPESKALRSQPHEPRPISKEEAAKLLPGYTEEEMRALESIYSPDQIESIKISEALIPPEDIIQQGVINRGPTTMTYLDDFSKIDPILDKPILAPEENYDPDLRFKDDDELAADLKDWASNLPENADRVEWQKYIDNARLMVGDEKAERNPRSYLMPELPKLKHEGLLGTKSPDEQVSADGEEPDEALQRLILQTGYTRQQIRKLLRKNLVFHSVTNQTRMGKVQSMYCLYVAGNGRGLLGIGEGKSTEPEDARRQAEYAAIRMMQPVPRYEERTIYGDVRGKVGGTEVELMTRHPGFGIRTQHRIYEMCRCAGIADLAARVTRARNPMNTVKATMQALLRQRIPDEIARARGRKLVDVRKVYYDGNT